MIVQRAVNAKAKAGLRSSIMIWESNTHYPRGPACFTTLFERCKPRGLLPKNPALRNPSPKKQNRSTTRPPLRLAAMSPSGLIARKRRKSIRRKSKTKKTLLRPLETTPSRVRKTTRSATIARKRAILQGTARNLQKTSVNLANLRANN